MQDDKDVGDAAEGGPTTIPLLKFNFDLLLFQSLNAVLAANLPDLIISSLLW